MAPVGLLSPPVPPPQLPPIPFGGRLGKLSPEAPRGAETGGTPTTTPNLHPPSRGKEKPGSNRPLPPAQSPGSSGAGGGGGPCPGYRRADGRRLGPSSRAGAEHPSPQRLRPRPGPEHPRPVRPPPPARSGPPPTPPPPSARGSPRPRPGPRPHAAPQGRCRGRAAPPGRCPGVEEGVEGGWGEGCGRGGGDTPGDTPTSGVGGGPSAGGIAPGCWRWGGRRVGERAPAACTPLPTATPPPRGLPGVQGMGTPPRWGSTHRKGAPGWSPAPPPAPRGLLCSRWHTLGCGGVQHPSWGRAQGGGVTQGPRSARGEPRNSGCW